MTYSRNQRKKMQRRFRKYPELYMLDRLDLVPIYRSWNRGMRSQRTSQNLGLTNPPPIL